MSNDLCRTNVLRAVVSDIIKSFNVDPCAEGLLQPALFFKVICDHGVSFFFSCYSQCDSILLLRQCSQSDAPLSSQGFHAITTYRVANVLWNKGGEAEAAVALMLQSRASDIFGVDIHPVAFALS